ncbi:MAG: M20/M25/M40 family metallo-hydrolase, partial [Gammaproteobacteria bacterium]|nr:M20/M25/M40 family metallo-hydrolase [Gammaproteobacteria bacterium]
AALDGSDLVPLTNTDAYDAEATICAKDGSIVFTSMRDGDLDLYRMDADGANVKRLTNTPGYDGGAFFSSDCSRIVWRASRPSGQALTDYRALLEDGLIRPGALEIWVALADGSEARQVTHLGGANFAPFFFADGKRIIFSSNHADPAGREFDIWAVNVDGTALERITYTPGFDGFPMFSPDGTLLAFGSNRNQANPGDTDVYVARWVASSMENASIKEAEVAPSGVAVRLFVNKDGQRNAADRYLADVAWLADDARGGRGLGTPGLAETADWLAGRFAAIGLEPAAGAGQYRQSFDAVVDVAAGPATAMAVGVQTLPKDDFVTLGFSANGEITARVVFAEWGIVSNDHDIDDYAGLDVEGAIVLVRRFTPTAGAFTDEKLRNRLGALRYKAFTAREHGAVGLLIADLPVSHGRDDGQEKDEAEPPLPTLRVDTQGDAGIPVAVIKRAWARALLTENAVATLSVDLVEKTQRVSNIVGRISAGGQRLPGAVLLGAHYDHLGFGPEGSFAPESHEPHNGADDNASGTAALLEVARLLAGRRDELERDVVFVAFTAEESGLLGSTQITREPPPGAAPEALLAMLNMDMVGRLRNNQVAVLGSDSAAEWNALVEPLCDELKIGCQLGGDGYGPSDQTPFYAAGVPVLHFFTGAHEDYHKPTDDVSGINAEGGARIAELVANLAANLTRVDALTYQQVEAPPPRGDVRGYGASLGTIPDYTGAPDDQPGMVLAGIVAGGPADQAGLERGDRIVELAGHEVRDIYDLMYVLRDVKPGEAGTVVVQRGAQRLTRDVTFGRSRRTR